MPRGGKRQNAGRKRKEPVPEQVNKQLATEILTGLGKDLKHPKVADKECTCELCKWRGILDAADARLRFDALKYLTDRRDGKAVQTVNHLHDKPIDVNMNITLGERMKSAMEKAEQRVGKRS